MNMDDKKTEAFWYWRLARLVRQRVWSPSHKLRWGWCRGKFRGWIWIRNPYQIKVKLAIPCSLWVFSELNKHLFIHDLLFNICETWPRQPGLFHCCRVGLLRPPATAPEPPREKQKMKKQRTREYTPQLLSHSDWGSGQFWRYSLSCEKKEISLKSKQGWW